MFGTPNHRMKNTRTELIVGIVLAAMAFALYANTIGNSYALDDELVTIEHRLTSQGIKAIPEIFTSHYFDNQIGNKYEYRPIVLATFAIEHQFITSPHVSHAINALLYALTAFLLFASMRSMWPQYQWPFAALVTVLFVAHPLHTEVVASIKNRDEILCFIGGILAMRFAFSFIRKENWLHYVLFIFFFLFGIMSKRSVLGFVVLLPLAVMWFHKVNIRQLVLVTAPLAFIFILFSPNSSDLVNWLIGIGFVLFPIVVNFLFFQNGGVLNNRQAILAKLRSATPTKGAAAPKADDTAVDIKPLFTALFVGIAAISIILLFFGYSWFYFAGLCVLGLLSLVSKQYKNDVFFVGYFVVALVAAFYFRDVLSSALAFMWLVINVIKRPKAQRGKYLGMIAVLTAVQLLMFFDNIASVIVGQLYTLVIIWVSFKFFIGKAKWWWVPYAVLFVFGVLAYRDGNDIVVMSTFISIGVLLLSYSRLGGFGAAKVAAMVLLPLSLFVFSFYYIPGGLIRYQTHPFVEQMLKQQEPTKMTADGYVDQDGFVPAAGRELNFVENPLVGETDKTVIAATALATIGRYVGLLVLPKTLIYYYGFDEFSVYKFTDVLPWVVLVLYLALLLFAFLKANKWPMLTFGIMYLLLSLLFISNLGVLVAGGMAERLVYVGSFGFVIVIAWLLFRLFKLSLDSDIALVRSKIPLLVLVAAILLAYSVRTVVRNTDWKDRFTLYSSDIENMSESAKGNQLMGFTYMNMGFDDPNKGMEYFKLAEKYYKKAIQLRPQFHIAVFNLGNMYANIERCDLAMPWLEKSLKLEPYFPDANFAYASCLDQQGDFVKAEEHYLRVKRERPGYLQVYINLGYMYFQVGDNEKFININMEALRIDPKFVPALLNIGKTYYGLGMFKEAVPFFERAYPLQPNDVNLVLVLSDIYQQFGDKARSEFYWKKAQQLGATEQPQ